MSRRRVWLGVAILAAAASDSLGIRTLARAERTARSARTRVRGRVLPFLRPSDCAGDTGRFGIDRRARGFQRRGRFSKGISTSPDLSSGLDEVRRRASRSRRVIGRVRELPPAPLTVARRRAGRRFPGTRALDRHVGRRASPRSMDAGSGRFEADDARGCARSLQFCPSTQAASLIPAQRKRACWSTTVIHWRHFIPLSPMCP